MTAVERRRNERIQCKMTVRFNNENAELIDISRTGLRLATYSAPLNKNISISMQSGINKIDLKGFVTWVNKSLPIRKNLSNEFGVAVNEAPLSFYEFLDDIFYHKEHKKTPAIWIIVPVIAILLILLSII